MSGLLKERKRQHGVLHLIRPAIMSISSFYGSSGDLRDRTTPVALKNVRPNREKKI
jgi:hypothetical protein